MTTNPENTCQLAVEQLMIQMESEHFSSVELAQLCQKFPDCSEQIRSTYDLWQELDNMALRQAFIRNFA